MPYLFAIFRRVKGNAKRARSGRQARRGKAHKKNAENCCLDLALLARLRNAKKQRLCSRLNLFFPTVTKALSTQTRGGILKPNITYRPSLRSRRLEEVGERENRCGQVRAPVFSRAHYFQAPATQASIGLPYTRNKGGSSFNP